MPLGPNVTAATNCAASVFLEPFKTKVRKPAVSSVDLEPMRSVLAQIDAPLVPLGQPVRFPVLQQTVLAAHAPLDSRRDLEQASVPLVMRANLPMVLAELLNATNVLEDPLRQVQVTPNVRLAIWAPLQAKSEPILVLTAPQERTQQISEVQAVRLVRQEAMHHREDLLSVHVVRTESSFTTASCAQPLISVKRS